MTVIAEGYIGTGGRMFIDDDGTNIRWYLSQSDPATRIFAPGKGWAITINGQNIGDNFTWPAGGGTRLIAGPATAYGNQTVAFAIGATGTQGFGNGGTIYGTVNRATVPDAPGAPSPSEVTVDQMRLTWTIPGNGGAAIDQMLLRRSTDPNFGAYTDYPLAANATTYLVTGLTPGTRYFWRVFAHNGLGYSPHSPTTSATTTGAPPAPSALGIDLLRPTSLRYRFTSNGGAEYKIDEWQVQRATNSAFTTGVQTLSSTGTTTFSSLTPDTNYYVRSRTHGLGGWGAWSSVSSVKTLGAPPAPTANGIDQITPTGLRFRFTSRGGVEYEIDQWQVQIATNSAFTTGVQTVASSGSTTFANLNSSTVYYLRARTHGSGGWSAWSSPISAQTMSGAYVSQNGVWVPIPVYVSTGSVWVGPELEVSNGTTWQNAI